MTKGIQECKIEAHKISIASQLIMNDRFSNIIQNNKKTFAIITLITIVIYSTITLNHIKIYKKTFYLYNHYSALTALPDPTPLLIYFQFKNPDIKVHCCPTVTTKKYFFFKLKLCTRPVVTTKKIKKETINQCMLFGHYTLLGALISSSIFYCLLLIYRRHPLWLNRLVVALLIKNCFIAGLFLPIWLRTITGVLHAKYHIPHDLITQILYSIGYSLVVFILPITLLLLICNPFFKKKNSL